MVPTADVADSIETALAHLRAGGVVSFPTDTLYALAADATNDAAVARVFAIKERAISNPLPLFVAGVEQAQAIGQFSPVALSLARHFWPGALTIVVAKQENFHSIALSGSETVALRAPDHPIALEILAKFDSALTATSANLSGGPNPATAGEVNRQIGDAVDYVLDVGPCAVGVASTIVDCSDASGWKVLRQGAIAEADVRAAIAEGGAQ